MSTYSTCDNTREDYARLRIEESPLRLLRNSTLKSLPQPVLVAPPFVLKSPKNFLLEAFEKEPLVSLSAHNYKFIQNMLVDTVLFIRSDNQEATIDEICKCLDQEVKNMRSGNIEYVLELKQQAEDLEAGFEQAKSEVLEDATD